MKNGSTPASPIEFKSAPNLSGNVSIKQWSGMTKREAFAMVAMQGLISNPVCNGSAESCAESAINYADAMLAELEKRTL